MPNLCKICKHELESPNKELFDFPTVRSDCRPWRKGRSVAICYHCGIAQRVGEVGDVYSDYAISHHGSNIARTRATLDALNIPAISVLDFGCGNGDAVKALKERYSYVSGYEPNSTKFISKKEFITTRYNLITMFQVLEHVEDLVAELTWAREHLTDNGILLIEVPYAPEWPFDFVVADHIWHFTPHSLRGVLELAGFECRISNDRVKKILTCEARAGLRRFHRPPPKNEIMALLAAIEWLVEYKRFLEGIRVPVTVFGTAPAAAWAGHILGDRATAYLDDNPVRQGHTFNRRMIMDPDGQIFYTLPTVAPFYGAQMADLLLKYPDLNLIQP